MSIVNGRQPDVDTDAATGTDPCGGTAPATPDAVLTVRDLVVRYGRGRSAARVPPAVDGVSFDIAAGETLGLVGESGSGKSTIGKALLGLQVPNAGSVHLKGRDITRATPKQRRTLAPELRIVFQDPYSSLNPARTIGQTLAEPLALIGVRGAEAEQRSVEALESVGLPGDVIDRHPAQFSGGQRQRIAIARALVCDPEVLVLDEPVSALDLSTQAQVLNLLADLRDQRGLAFLFIAHDLGVVRFLADRVAVLYRGQIMEIGPADALSSAPRHPYTLALTAAAPVPRPAEQAVRRARREALGVGSASTAPPGQGGCPFAARCPLATERCHAERPVLDMVDDHGTACHHSDRVEDMWRSSSPDHEN
ncbi:MAG: oligopeptide/dipeptide ABC transporter ATP-binding protein [Acidimicrobiales bacterium]